MHTTSIKSQFLQACSTTHQPISVIAKQYGIPRSTAYLWAKENKMLANTKQIAYKDYYKLQHKLKQKELELEIYKALHCFPDAPTKEKQIAITKLMGVYPIKTMCRLLNMPIGTLYNYHLRRKQVTDNQKRDDYLKKRILEVYLQSGKRFGAKKIEAKLRMEGINSSLGKVQSIMKLLNIQSIQKLNKTEQPNTDNSQYYVNKLKRMFHQDSPNKYWVSDITELRIGRNKFYLCVILDLFSRKVIAYRLATQNNTQLVINTFKDAYESRNCPQNLSFHSDQGSNYTSFVFRSLLQTLKVNQSFSKSGNPYDNACMESFFSSFKREEYNTKHYNYLDELKDSIDSYMTYYNSFRPHQTLHNKTPNQVENEYYSAESVKNQEKNETE